MSDYNWCHGPSCHTQETQSRVRGSKGNKVLRTIKISNNSRNQFGNNIFDYFCNTRCLYDYLGKHAQAISAIAPRREALETPINDPYKDHTHRGYSTWTIDKKVG
jgi:hypothetical protein